MATTTSRGAANGTAMTPKSTAPPSEKRDNIFLFYPNLIGTHLPSLSLLTHN
jgi:hypothetical protein